MESKKDKFKRTLIDLANNEKFIPGIYNYCDRWCERCTMTSKCLTFAHEQAMKMNSTDPETNDISNEKFWESLRLSFQVTFELLEEDAKRFGIDLNNLPDVEIKKGEEKPVEKRSKKYSTQMLKWLHENNEALKSKAEQLLFISNNEEPALKFADAWEVVQWYSVFISAKVHRAHFELDERLEDPEDEYNLMSANLGSAKIALIAIDRSVSALSTMYSAMPENEDDYLKFLAQLSQIKKLMIETFPEAMSFKRPGFDE
ncbi:MAG: hypothetical protein JXR61_00035 [Prolixibacteraceae bacterium]|nr:hypothetical protein [Prolixibacteraceae bacterium]